MAKDKAEDIFAELMAEEFIPENYEVPSESRYMRFEQGSNKFRILSKPIMGYEFWNEGKDGNRVPLRFKMDEQIPVEKLDEPENGKHFWAMVVWNFKHERVQILEITQKGILRTLRGLAQDPEWGSPLKYNITVNRKGESLQTQYDTVPNPPSDAPEVALEQLKQMNINLEALFSGDDPFSKD